MRESPRPLPQAGAGKDKPLVIGLVNNMPDAALPSTERQFRGLLAAASSDRPICLRLFAPPGSESSTAGRGHLPTDYEDISGLWGSHVDGLIVTGREPRAASLTDEPYWPLLTRLVDWAECHTLSAIWSCLAAHAAVLHLHSVSRQPFRRKLSGVFDCVKTTDHALTAGCPVQWRVPHSRCNDLPEPALATNGYRILARSPDAGAGMFIQQRNSLFVFLQGHLEYDPDSLLREYRRDIGRFLAGKRDTYPDMPLGYFDAASAIALATFRERAVRRPSIGLLSDFPFDATRLTHPWREPAIRIYSNWLAQLLERRSGDGAPTTTAELYERA